MYQPPRPSALYAFKAIKAILVARGNAEIAKSYVENHAHLSSKADVLRVLRSMVDVVMAPDEPLPADTSLVLRLRATSLLGQIPGFTERPAYSGSYYNTTPLVASYTGEAKPIPVGPVVLAPVVPLVPKKQGVIVVFSDACVRDTSITADYQFRADVEAAFGPAQDAAAFDPANTGDDAKPASLTSNQPSIVSTGDFAADVASLAGLLVGDPRKAVLVMNSTDALRAGAVFTTPTLGLRGGDYAGTPVYVSPSIPRGVVVLLDPSQIQIQRGPVELSYVQNAAVQMDTAPTDPPTPVTALHSLWQLDCVGLRVVEYSTWALPPPGAAPYISGAFAS